MTLEVSKDAVARENGEGLPGTQKTAETIGTDGTTGTKRRINS